MRLDRPLRRLLSAAAVAACISLGHAAVELDEALPEYQPTTGVSGSLASVGSDTLNNLMTFWAEGFQELYPTVKIEIEGKGSSTAPPALTKGTAQLGPMSREMKKEEVDAFEKKWGYKPTAIAVAIDALAVFVHKDNPVTSLTMQQVDAIFSSSYKRGGTNAATWGDVGLTGEWAAKPISLYGRNSASGTYGYFKEHALKKGDFKSSVKEQPGSSTVVQGVANDLGGIGYSGIGYLVSGVRAVPLADKKEAVEATYVNAENGSYPLSRYLYVYINKKPGSALDPLTGEFLKFVLSRGGQQVVIKDGYFPLTAKVAEGVHEALK
ncbi:MAG TPA: PstS family phosphate ABC transporter substrate-binding protein [Planctomycetota bacterium]|nr:PstS family phosphate ABC transporter substrate-binding protein [Planctomycetota bacterium]